MSDRKGMPLPATPPAADNTADSLDKVRDILFGAQSRDFDKRFAVLEEQLLQKTVEAREEARQHLEKLAAQVRQQVLQLTEKLKSEQAERTQTVKALTSEMKSLTQALDQKISQLDDKSGKGQNELRQELITQAKALSGDIQRRAEELNSEVKELDSDKLNRSDIALIFNEMAKRFAGEKVK